ncbi:hypothetical protein DM860_015742 [Cuscuta australis]|uniref:Uncharacterized protein n=1 Tax=Cuscuta australis TaxID=267555 RepID=A0A328DQL0_9ASTE|nr:hypothetical protein DM860_015742 [Cuscuta australis]
MYSRVSSSSPILLRSGHTVYRKGESWSEESDLKSSEDPKSSEEAYTKSEADADPVPAKGDSEAQESDPANGDFVPDPEKSNPAEADVVVASSSSSSSQFFFGVSGAQLSSPLDYVELLDLFKERKVEGLTSIN